MKSSGLDFPIVVKNIAKNTAKNIRKTLTIQNSFVNIFEYAAQGGRSVPFGATELGE